MHKKEKKEKVFQTSGKTSNYCLFGKNATAALKSDAGICGDKSVKTVQNAPDDFSFSLRFKIQNINCEGALIKVIERGLVSSSPTRRSSRIPGPSEGHWCGINCQYSSQIYVATHTIGACKIKPKKCISLPTLGMTFQKDKCIPNQIKT